MHQKFIQRATWLLFGLMLPAPLAPAADQLRILPSSEELATDAVPGILLRVEKFESEQRWGEALSIYEEALRDHPENTTLGKRHDVAKIHYDLSRRYSDSSFLRALRTMPERQALGVYSEVLIKIESHYVNEPDWAALVVRGTQDLEIAVTEKSFRQLHLPAKSNAQLDGFVQQLRRLINSRAPRTRQQALDTVSAVIQLGRQQLQIAPAAISLEYACGAIGSLDPYSSYLTSDQLTDVYSQIEGNFVGLGIELKANSGSLQIVKVITGSPAERSGMRAGDRITEVDGKLTADLTTDQAADLLQGQEGTTVRIVALTADGATRRLSVRREHVEVPSVDEVRMVDAASGVGYLKLTCFQKTTSRDLDTALRNLAAQGMRSLIMDLRGNPGGLLTSSVEIADKFIEEGIIVSTRGRSALEDFNYTAHKAGTWSVPLVVLIDGDSASASEIFAGAIRDHRRGKLVGQRSYGKGSVQGIFPLTVANSGVRLTTAKFYSPSGAAISHVGVKPDIVVQQTAKLSTSQMAFAGGADDAILAAGLQAARTQVANRQ